jgi:hypothetical protein
MPVQSPTFDLAHFGDGSISAYIVQAICMTCAQKIICEQHHSEDGSTSWRLTRHDRGPVTANDLRNLLGKAGNVLSALRVLEEFWTANLPGDLYTDDEQDGYPFNQDLSEVVELTRIWCDHIIRDMHAAAEREHGLEQ